MSELAKRVLTAAALIPVGLFVVLTRWGNAIPLFVVLWVFQILLLTEIAGMVENRGYKFNLWSTSVLVTLNTLNFYLYGRGFVGFDLFMGLWVGLVSSYTVSTLFLESIKGRNQHAFEEIGFSLFSFIIAGLFFTLVGMLKLMDMSGWLVMIVLAVAWSADTGGLIFGMWLGKTPLPFLSSPKKTLEGYIGAVLTALVAGLVLYFIQNNTGVITNFSLLEFLIIAFILGVSGLVGDLGESTLKRWAGVKDSGTILPGHGGIYDRFDSILVAAPAFFVILKILGY